MANNQQTPAWHTISLQEVMQRLETSDRGLSAAEAKRRLEELGPNSLPEAQATPPWVIVGRQFLSPLIYILLAAAAVSLFLGDFKDAAFIAAVLVINAMIGSYQEWRAEQSGQALRQLLTIHATVERNGEIRGMPAEQIVPGDLIWLESGNRVPADLRLITARGLEIDESLLTGESLAVEKDPDWQGEEQAPLGDRANIACAGAIVTRGRAKGITIETGARTMVGRLALDVETRSGGRPPLIQRMERFTKVISIATISVAILIGFLGALAGRYAASDMFLFVVALAVSAIPEGLPVAMTVALAIATTRMARRGVIVRRLSAVEGLGSCTLIATDKTGTLTVNEMTVREVRLPGLGTPLTVTGQGYSAIGEILAGEEPVRTGQQPLLDALARAAVLCNEAELHRAGDDWESRGDSVDIALLSFALKLGWQRPQLLEACPQLNEIAFESENQYAASFHQTEEGHQVFVKGAPERVLPMCQDDENLGNQVDIAKDMAARGLRVLALAEGASEASVGAVQEPPEPNGLRLLGLVGMMDPLRPGAREAVHKCHESGVSVAMVTGDHRLTATSIARALGMHCGDDEVITGPELIGLSSKELVEVVRNVRVFARVAPHQKLQIVEAARVAGHFVAVTGDGVNDAPALKAANIGVAMGKSGTDVAREAADLVISDDNFATIIVGIEEGRVAYDNIRKVIYLLISTGGAELVLMGLAITTGMPLPLLPVQILWLNLVTNGIQDVALAFEPGEDDILKRKPRSPKESIFNRLMVERTLLAAIIGGGLGFAAFHWMITHGWDESSARNALLLMLVLFENFHIGNCRSETRSAFARSPLRSPLLLAGALIALSIHIAVMHLPFMQDLLGTGPVSSTTWLIAVALAVLIVPAMECHKWLWRRRYPQESR